MPTTYAHYRFGTQMLNQMPGDIRRVAKRFRRLFDMGLHGPDLLFYGPSLPTKGMKPGRKFHYQTGKDFFTRVCRGLRLEPNEAGCAYLYGLLCHYCLDSLCHPFVEEQTKPGQCSHAEIEAEFDRFLLETDGKIPPHRQDLSLHIRLTPGECETAARFYPGISTSQIRLCVQNMSLLTKLMATPEGVGRTLLRKGMGLASQSDLVMPVSPNPGCTELDGQLLDLYNRAAEHFTPMLAQLIAHMTYNAPLGEEFAPIFG